MPKCPNCGAFCRSSALYCTECRTPLGKLVERFTEHGGSNADTADNVAVKRKFCRYCGVQLKPGAKFCRSCGLPQDKPKAAGNQAEVQSISPDHAAGKQVPPDVANVATPSYPLAKAEADSSLFSGAPAPQCMLGTSPCPVCRKDIARTSFFCPFCGMELQTGNADFSLSYFASAQGVPTLRANRLMDLGGPLKLPILKLMDCLIIVSSSGTGAVTVLDGMTGREILNTQLKFGVPKYPAILTAGMLLIPGDSTITVWDVASRILNRSPKRGFRDGVLQLDGQLADCLHTDNKGIVTASVRTADGSYYVDVFRSNSGGGLEKLTNWGPFLPQNASASNLFSCCNDHYILAGFPGEWLRYFSVDDFQKGDWLPFMLDMVQPYNANACGAIFNARTTSGCLLYCLDDGDSLEPRILLSETGNLVGFSEQRGIFYFVTQEGDGNYAHSLNAEGLTRKTRMGSGATALIAPTVGGALFLMSNGQLHALCCGSANQRYTGQIALDKNGDKFSPDMADDVQVPPVAVGSYLYLADSRGWLWSFTPVNGD